MDLCTASDSAVRDSNVTVGVSGAADTAVTVLVDDLTAITASVRD